MDAASMSSTQRLDASFFGMTSVEETKYMAFFNSLDSDQDQIVAQADAVELFVKSGLSHEIIQSLWRLVKASQLFNVPTSLNATEFMVIMHLIVCLTKRGLSMDQLDESLPKHLFPTIDFKTCGPAPSPTVAAGSESKASIEADDAATAPAALIDASSFHEFLAREAKNSSVVMNKLVRLLASEDKSFALFQQIASEITAQIEELGFPVPATARSLDAIDDLGNLIKSHTQTIRQEIQALQIAEQMRLAVETDEDRQEASQAAARVAQQDQAVVERITRLVTQLTTLQHEASTLLDKRITLENQLDDAKRAQAQVKVKEISQSSSTSSTPTATPKTEVVQASPTPASASNDDFGWGAF